VKKFVYEDNSTNHESKILFGFDRISIKERGAVKGVVYKISLIMVTVCLRGIACAGDEVISAGHNFICDNNNLCSAFFENESAKVEKFCNPSHFSITWKRGREIYLFQCRGRGTTEGENKNWIVDIQHNIYFKVGYGRFYDQNKLIANPDIRIPDSFQARPLCHPAIDEKLRTSDFVLLDKRPSDDEQNPYCYEPTYLTISGGQFHILTSEGTLHRSDADHQMYKASASEKMGLQTLLKSLH
jgi:hypothetical protein